MRLLLDSHAFLWALTAPGRLRPTARAAIAEPANQVVFSAVNLWELAIGRAKGRLRFVDDEMHAGIREQGFIELPVTSRHGLAAAALPRLHGDPFDRMLVAQAMIEGLTLVTHDWLVRRYPVALMEA